MKRFDVFDFLDDGPPEDAFDDEAYELQKKIGAVVAGQPAGVAICASLNVVLLSYCAVKGLEPTNDQFESACIAAFKSVIPVLEGKVQP